MVKKMKTKFHKSVEWIKPFVKSANGLVDLKKLNVVRGYKVVPHKQIGTYASIIRNGNNKSFSINMLTHHNDVLTATQYPEYVEPFLDTLAHELAHIVHWEHTVEHFELKVRILARFSKVIKQLGIKDTYQRITRMKNK